MTSFNKVIIAGNVSRDIEVRHIPSGTAVADVSLAINSQWKDKTTNEKHEEVTFVECTLWGRTAELAGEYLKKGSAVLFEGSLKQESWEDKETGKKRSKLKVNVETMQFLDGKGGGGGGGNKGGNGSSRGGSQQKSSDSGRDYSEYDQTADERRGGNRGSGYNRR